ncbi:MAG: DUF1178 family protein [Albidovulum sp.]|nr:DUF1178 family protein [Albidovulum sp.]MDE0305036.1 DUF1178 family protein [Albidovulum sp.]MDE0532850.1 DUF1178 family protein [Albidovulum sp.]
MIRFTLGCADDHEFESWFKSNDAYDSLAAAGMIACPVCGSCNVGKKMMAPQVSTRNGTKDHKKEQQPVKIADPKNKFEKAIEKLKRKIEKESEYVGTNFANEARAIHSGESPERSIFGEAHASETRALIEEGVPIAPLPWIPTCKSN